MGILGLFQAIFNFFAKAVESYNNERLLKAGAALRDKDVLEKEHAIKEHINKAKSRLTDADIDQLLRKPSERKHAVHSDSSGVFTISERPDER